MPSGGLLGAGYDSSSDESQDQGEEAAPQAAQVVHAKGPVGAGLAGLPGADELLGGLGEPEPMALCAREEAPEVAEPASPSASDSSDGSET